MIRGNKLLLWLTAGWAIGAGMPAWSATTVLAGMFDGAEPAIAPVPGSRCSNSAMPYRQSEFTVSVSGVYSAYSGLPNWANAPALSMSIYDGTFDPASPLANRVGFWRDQNSVVPASDAQLSEGRAYRLVVQQECERKEGAWAVGLVGPGTAQSADAVVVPDFTQGRFSDSDPRMPYPQNCGGEGMRPYKVIGPFQVSRSGRHYLQSPVYANLVETLCMGVHSAPPSANDPDSNLVTRVFLAGQVDLEAGRDYWLMIIADGQHSTREYSFVLAPPAPFRINKWLADAWYNPDMPGQGVFLDVFENRNTLFLGWFTYALDGEPADETRHRWLTAFGGFQGTRADLDLEWTTVSQPRIEGDPPDQHIDGTLDIEFEDCRSGLIRYAWGASDSGVPLVEGEMPIRRLTDDSVALCESLYAGPGMPGPL